MAAIDKAAIPGHLAPYWTTAFTYFHGSVALSHLRVEIHTDIRPISVAKARGRRPRNGSQLES
jgi:hypothetical protein